MQRQTPHKLDRRKRGKEGGRRFHTCVCAVEEDTGTNSRESEKWEAGGRLEEIGSRRLLFDYTSKRVSYDTKSNGFIFTGSLKVKGGAELQLCIGYSLHLLVPLRYELVRPVLAGYQRKLWRWPKKQTLFVKNFYVILARIVWKQERIPSSYRHARVRMRNLTARGKTLPIIYIS